MDFTYEELSLLNGFLSADQNLPPEIKALNDKMTAYFAEPTRSITPEMVPAETRVAPGEDHIAEYVEPSDDIPADILANLSDGV